ncbi:MAG: DUF1002 domain-containing protein [Candidatus Pelethousia sp.]|nr:DUF1002 domain-containing protein [Candidatus Pelethousia sp.]
MKKWIAAALAGLFLLALVAPVLALDAGQSRVAIGADLDEAQIEQVYADFGLQRGNVRELTVTNADERAYLEGLVSDKKIGKVALSCVYITTLEQGAGLSISSKNINWCSNEMYVNALTTAGITDAQVMVTAPFAVSGTAALTGIYRAYEDITGTSLSDLAKSIGAEELVVTGELAEYIGSEEAAGLINELKKILDQTQNMSDEDVKAEIRKIAKQYNVEVTDAQVDQLLALCRKLEKLDVDALKKQLISLTETVQKAGKAQAFVSSLGEKVTGFFSSVGQFFSGLFGGKKG